MGVTVLIPAFNEGETLEDVVVGASLHSDFQIVVNDGSFDETDRLLPALKEKLPSLTVITHEENRGMASALRSGFYRIVSLLDTNRLDPDHVVVMMDGDGQHLPEEIPGLAGFLEKEGLDLLIGCRDFSVYPLYKRMGNLFLSLWGRLLVGFPFQDIECGFKAIRAGALPALLKYYSGFRYSCAQEIALISVHQGLKVGNNHPVRIPLYRRGARLRDVFPVLAFSLRAFFRLHFNRTRDFRRDPFFSVMS